MKTTIFTVVTAVLLALSGLAMAGSRDMTKPIWLKVKSGDTEQTVAKRYGLTVAELRQLNAGNLSRRADHHLIPGELLNVNLGSDQKYWGMTRWNFDGGDPAGPSLVKLYEAGASAAVAESLQLRLRRLIPLMQDVPVDVRERFLSQLEWQKPCYRFVRSTVDSPLVIHGLAFGGYQPGSKLKYWSGDVICLWANRPGQWIAEYDPVQSPGDELTYQLIAFLGCQNGSVRVGRLPPVIPVAPPETTVVVPVPPETVVVEIPPPPPPVIPVAPPVELKSREYYRDYVAWLTDEFVRVDPNGKSYADRTQNNVFIGQEVSFWTTPAKRMGLRLRNAEAIFDSKARSGDHNLGLVWVPFSNRFLRLDLEGGLGYSAMQRVYIEVRHPNEYTWEWNERKKTTDGFGPYVRAQVLLPGDIYADVKWRDHGVIEDLGGYVTARPGWFYAKAAYNDQFRPTAARHFDGQTVFFPDDEMTMNEGRLGVSFSPRFLAFGSYQHWEYESTSGGYWFTRFGPGGGFEWYPFRSPAWRIDGSAIRFRDLDHIRYQTNAGPVNVHSRDREWRIKLGVVWAPQPK